MEFVLMKLEFNDSISDSTINGFVDPANPPTFHEISTFKTIGVVMNVFLLDPPSRLLCAFVWVSSSNTIGLYALLDWAKSEYVFIDTGIECVSTNQYLYACYKTQIRISQSMSSNWSCILYKEQIVIHSEESDMAHQYFYPISDLAKHSKIASLSPNFIPTLSARVNPTTIMSAPFVFPRRSDDTTNSTALTDNTVDAYEEPDTNTQPNGFLETNESSHSEDGDESDDDETASTSNPFPFPPWYPESAHFVRQWWPTLPSVPKLSCTVVLLADHDPDSHRTRYVLAQHYFKVPLQDSESVNEEALKEGTKALEKSDGAAPGYRELEPTPLNGITHTLSHSSEHTPDSHGNDKATSAEDAALRIWYVSQPFEVVCVIDGFDELNEDGTHPDRPRPLMAVDFGHAVWVEYIESEGEHRAGGGNGDLDEPSDPKRLRFVSFPPVTTLWEDETDSDESLDESNLNGTHDQSSSRVEGVVRTLEIPTELDLSTVETINIDQSQGAVIVSVAEGKIFILYYE